MGIPKQTCTIGAGQLFAALFIGRFLIVLTVNSLLSGGENILDNVISEIAAYLLNFLIVIPIWIMNRRRPTLNILDQSYFLMGQAGMIICLFYAIYFVVVNWYYLSFFQLYIGNVMEVKTPVWLVAVAVLAVACYGAFRGIEAVLRASGVILVVICAGLVFIIATLFTEIDPLNYQPLLYEGPRQAVAGLLLFLSRNSGFALMALFLPSACGHKKTAFFVWNTGICLLLTILLTVIVGAAGDYLRSQLFPVYTAVSMAEIGPFQRMDAIYLGMWMMGLFIKISFDLYAISFCISKIWGDRAGKISILVGAALIACVSQLSVMSRAVQNIIYSLWLLGAFTIMVSIVIPLLVLIMDVVKHGKKKGKEGTP